MTEQAEKVEKAAEAEAPAQTTAPVTTKSVRRSVRNSSKLEESIFSGVEPPKSVVSDSPLLDSPVIERGYAQGAVPGTGEQPAVVPPSSSEFVGQATATPPPASSPKAFSFGGKKLDTTTAPMPQAPVFEQPVPDATWLNTPGDLPPPPPTSNIPEMSLTEQALGDGTNAQGLKDAVKNEAAGDLAEMFLNFYERLVPDLSHDFTKIKEGPILAHEKAGDLPQGISNEIVTLNKKNHKEFKTRATEDVKMLRKPLERLMAEKNVSMSPTTELIMVLCFIAITYFMLFIGIKKENDRLYNAIISKIDSHGKKTPSEQIIAEQEAAGSSINSKKEEITVS